MANRERKNELKIYLSDDKQYILEQKIKASGMKSKSVFLRRQILYGFVYDIDYSELREYNAALGKIGNNLNQIAKRMNATGNVYAADVNQVKELMKKVHALKTAIHETINCHKNPAKCDITTDSFSSNNPPKTNYKKKPK